MRVSASPFAILLTAILVGGCAAAPAPRVADAQPVKQAVDPGPASIESEIGGMSDYDVERAVERFRPALDGCFGDASERNAALGGRLTLNLRVSKSGAVKHAYLSESTLGDRATEKCILDKAKARAWPKPLGGDGLIAQRFDIDARTVAIVLDEKRVQRQVSEARRTTSRCRRGIPGGFMATAYVKPDGRVLAAGVAVPNEHGEGAADCVVEAIRKVRFAGSPKVAKVSFELR